MLDGWAKRDLLIDLGRESGLTTFIETGTADANTVCHLAPHFDQLVTIEIGQDFYDNAIRMTISLPQVTCIYGDSAVVMEWLLAALPNGPALYWLDAHYNGRGDGANPLMRELSHILYREQNNWILIDDAREFGVDPAYPTLQEIESLVSNHPGPRYSMDIEDDIIRLVPNR